MQGAITNYKDESFTAEHLRQVLIFTFAFPRYFYFIQKACQKLFSTFSAGKICKISKALSIFFLVFNSFVQRRKRKNIAVRFKKFVKCQSFES